MKKLEKYSPQDYKDRCTVLAQHPNINLLIDASVLMQPWLLNDHEGVYAGKSMHIQNRAFHYVNSLKENKIGKIDEVLNETLTYKEGILTLLESLHTYISYGVYTEIQKGKELRAQMHSGKMQIPPRHGHVPIWSEKDPQLASKIARYIRGYRTTLDDEIANMMESERVLTLSPEDECIVKNIRQAAYLLSVRKIGENAANKDTPSIVDFGQVMSGYRLTEKTANESDIIAIDKHIPRAWAFLFLLGEQYGLNAQTLHKVHPRDGYFISKKVIKTGDEIVEEISSKGMLERSRRKYIEIKRVNDLLK